MNREYEFSVVVFAKDTAKLYRTFKNVREVTPEGTVQILAVCIAGDMDIPDERDMRELEEAGEKEKELKDEELDKIYGEFNPEDPRFREMLDDRDLLYIDGLECGDLVAELKDKIAGSYVVFAKAGIRFSPKSSAEIRRCFEEENRDVVLTKIRGKGNIHVREHNNYCNRFTEKTTLDNNVYLLHQLYTAYTFAADQVKWVSEIRPEIWYLDVMTMVYQSVVSCRSLGVASGEDIYVQILADHLMVEDWKNMLQDPDQLEVFYQEFFRKIADCRIKENPVHEKNADYVLLYYSAKIADIIFDSEELDEEKKCRYEEGIESFLKQMEFPEIVMSNQHISRANKVYLLRKYYPDICKKIPDQADTILNPIYDNLRVKIFQPEKDQLHCEFSIVEPVSRTNRAYMMTGGNTYEARWKYTLERTGWCREESAVEKLYIVDIPLSEIREFISWGTGTDGHINKMYNISYGKYVPFTKKLPLFLHIEDKLLYLNEKVRMIRGEDQEDAKVLGHQYEVTVEPYSQSREKQLKKKRTKAIFSQGKAGKKAVLVRKLYEMQKAKQKKQIWLISDRTTRGDDNGEVMFRYLCANPDPTVEPYFVVNKDTQDYVEMKKLGKVVEPFSWKHKLLFLLNEFSLSSQANKPVINPFGKLEYLYRDIIYDKKLVFLQHGVTKDNQSKWLNKYNRNLFGFIVSTKPEYDSAFTYDYFYPEKNIWLTGMPRYDRLVHDERKYVTVMPTWRKSLSSGTDARGVWQLGKEFQESEYFHFYDDLLNNERLLGAAEKYGYTICFMPHPNTIDGLHMFRHDPRVKFMDSSYSYKDIFAQTDLMITDYSSVAFDFAYLRKPIVYSQFDRDSFFSGAHSYTEGYFDYERDGFGEVEHTLDGTVDRIIEYMADGCQMKEEYRKRMDETFAFNDRNCSKRVYERIIENR